MKARIEAFKHAFHGARTLIATQPHARFHVVATVVTVSLGFLYHITSLEWALIVFSISIIWLSEAMNTALEFLADEVSLEWRERIKHAKDIAAFSVLAAAIGAATIGILIFAPYVFGRS
ncbi:diacylglycerol kinase family protein [Geminisphaera colitermitum]|uniref:diacylglycerol kinase family protein n=1 Tax=Geminisphaera colitermitum TaxID=1148786 RepID=UPI000158CDD3|nr:diacylglycerol kinase family protein [Geminisphaera colitermitum]